MIIEGSKKRKNDREKDSKDPVTILLDSIYTPTSFDKYDQQFAKPEYKEYHNYNKVVKRINKIDSAYFAKNNVIVLDGVEIVDDKKDPLTDGRQIPYGSPSYRLNVDSIQSAGNVFVLDLFRRLRSVQIRGNAPDYTVSIRGGMMSMSGQVEPLLLLDGTPVTLDFLQNMPAANVQFIDVLTGMQATLYGSRGAGGVIAIYTKSGTTGYFSDERVNWGIISVKMIGAQTPTSFYSPKFEADLNNRVKPMFFNTLYWNPNITLLPGKDNDIYFYTSDETAEYKIIVEGLSSDGIPIRNESFITVE